MLILMCHVNINAYVLYIYIYIANFRIPQIHECPPQFCLLDIMSPHGTSEKKNIHQFIQSLAWFKKQLTYQ